MTDPAFKASTVAPPRLGRYSVLVFHAIGDRVVNDAGELVHGHHHPRWDTGSSGEAAEFMARARFSLLRSLGCPARGLGGAIDVWPGLATQDIAATESCSWDTGPARNRSAPRSESGTGPARVPRAGAGGRLPHAGNEHPASVRQCSQAGTWGHDLARGILLTPCSSFSLVSIPVGWKRPRGRFRPRRGCHHGRDHGNPAGAGKTDVERLRPVLLRDRINVDEVQACAPRSPASPGMGGDICKKPVMPDTHPQVNPRRVPLLIRAP